MNTFTLELTLAEAGAVAQSLSKTLTAEQAKIRRNGKGNPISKAAAANWQLLEGVTNQLHEQMGELMEEYL